MDKIMLLEIDYHNGVPIYRQLIEQIRHQIMAGQIIEGQQLVSVRELATRLAVNPMTISKAYTLLEAEGLVERRRGVGLFVTRLPKDHKVKTQAAIIEEFLKQAAISAVQFGLSEEQIRAMLLRLYKKYNSKTREERDITNE
jgi:GntR family transcriptional regulator